MNVHLKILDYNQDSIDQIMNKQMTIKVGPSDLTLEIDETLIGRITEVRFSANNQTLPVDFTFITDQDEKRKFSVYQLKDFEEK